MAGRIDFLREAAPRISTIQSLTVVLTMAAAGVCLIAFDCVRWLYEWRDHE